MEEYFYTKIVDTNHIHQKINMLLFSESEKAELIDHLHIQIHHLVLDIVLSELPKSHHEVFLHHFSKKEHELVWKHLKTHIKDIEKKIRSEIQKLFDELSEDISEAEAKPK